ncbi:hypothetical protein CAL12_23505 [Bordetella genomosp. 8]|uniref:AB hydrolase-1 domain-containing protein n=1 Tax=Bordetella genomosp. 8 TaxID=1416806 RepID=A0A1W6YR57_9BORD|nr:alpha/beta hydrolase [Bordetella genomosp. 8]ARP83494.1 hypothetical protein CAL12_23505 [Bordetella genomosp. 8]
MSFIMANGIRTFFRSVGEGPPLLLIAGNGMDHKTFDEQLPLFARDFQCIVYDMRGVGQSDIPEDGYTIKEMARDALALLDALDIRACHVGGYSLGGAIALECVLAAPDRFKSLSLYASYDRPDPYLRLRYDLLIKVLQDATPEIWALFSAYSAFGEAYVNANEASVRQEIARRVARGAQDDARATRGLMGHYQAILSHDVADRLGQIELPTWIAAGSDDHVMPPHYARRMHAAIAGSRLEIFPDRPHRLLNFHAEPFTARAHDFLLEHR